MSRFSVTSIQVAVQILTGFVLLDRSSNFGINNHITVNGDISTVSSHAIAIAGYAHDSYIVVNGNVQSTNNAGIHISETDTVNNIVTVNGNVSTSATSANPTIAFNRVPVIT